MAQIMLYKGLSSAAAAAAPCCLPIENLYIMCTNACRVPPLHEMLHMIMRQPLNPN